MRILTPLLVTTLLCLGASGCLQTGKQPVQMEARISALERNVNQLEQELERERQARRSEDEALKAEIDRIAPARRSTVHNATASAQNATREEAGIIEAPEIEDRPGQPEATGETAAEAPAEGEPSETASPGAARQQYQKALDTLLSGNPIRSQKMFKSFIEGHPQSPLLPNAYYWLGESYYVQKQFAQSILAFKEVSNQFPEDPKAPDALLKMGYAYANLDQDSNARFYLEALIKKYPDSKSAKLAQKSLEDLR